MKQERIPLAAGFFPAAAMGLLLLCQALFSRGILPRSIAGVAGAELLAFLPLTVLLRLLKNEAGERPRFRFRPYKRQTVWCVAALSLTAALLAALLNCGMALLLDGHYYTQSIALEHYGITGFGGLLLTAVLLPAVVEELFFRGVLLSALEPYGTWPALILSSLAFALIHGNLYNLAGPLAAGMIYGYMTYALDSVWPAIFAHLLNNGLSLALSGGARICSALGLWPYVMLAILFCFCAALALSMRSLERQIEKNRIRRLQYKPLGQALRGLLIAPGMWLLLVLFLIRVLK